jgi:hypothetical protein
MTLSSTHCRRIAGVAALAATLVASLPAHATPAACGVQALSGLYVFTATGSSIVGGAAQPKAIVELIRMNGDGTLLVGGATRSVNGVIAQIPPGGTGTYTLEADCRGSLVFTGGPSFDIFVSPKGVEFWMIQTNPDNVFQGNVKRVSR